jgi:hypothetical protein
LGFLRQLTWVDLRTQTLDLGTAILAKAARGEPPGPDLKEHLDVVRASICPYRGLFHFREEDAAFFFGREASVDRLIDEVQRQPFVAVVGASGSGKSSVVRAGLIPRLRQTNAGRVWEIATLVPTDRPLHSLAAALLPILEPEMTRVDRLAEINKLAGHFAEGTVALRDVAADVLRAQPGTDRLLLFVDQWEELYTLVADDGARRRFLAEILDASAKGTVTVVFTLRGDFFGQAVSDRSFADRLQDAQINLGPMTREELECAIRKPAEKIQLEFEAGLVRRILNDVRDEPGNLPLLEFVLKELWDNRHGGILSNETYDAIGGLHGAVAAKADELFKGLSSAEQKILQLIFLRIVRPSAESGLDTRRRAAFTELPREAIELVTKLANERLLVTNQSASGLEQTVEVAHEALISNWSTLHAWVNEDREFLLWRDRLGPLVAEWERAQESNEALLRGPLLIEAQKWFDQRSQDLSDQERKFISASREERERLAREEKERRERELEAARKLADAQKERAEQAEKARQLEAERAAEAERVQRLEAERAKEADERRKEQVEAAQRLTEEQKQRAELSEQSEKEQKESANKLRRRAFAAAGAAGVALILLVVSVLLWRNADEQARIAAIQRNAAEEQALAAQNALTDSFFRTIGLSDAKIPTRDEREALWELAQLDGTTAIVREKLLDRWFDRAESFTRGEARDGQGFWAATGLNMKYHRRATSNAAKLGSRLAAVLENPQETDFSRLMRLGEALAALTNKMEPQAAAEIAKRGAQRLAAVLENPKETDSLRLSRLDNVLAALANKMEPQAAAEIAKGLAAVLENPQETDSDRLMRLGDVLAALANKMEPQAAAEIAKRGAQRLAAVLENPQETDSARLMRLGEALAALANKMEPQAAAEIAKRGAQRLAAVLENPQETDSDRLMRLGEALAALTNKMQPQAAAEIAKGLAAVLENSPETDSYRLSDLGDVLAALANKIEPQAAAEIAKRGAQRLAAVLENPPDTYFGSPLRLGAALAALANKMEPQAAAEIAKRGAQRLAAVLENPPEIPFRTASAPRRRAGGAGK